MEVSITPIPSAESAAHKVRQRLRLTQQLVADGEVSRPFTMAMSQDELAITLKALDEMTLANV